MQMQCPEGPNFEILLHFCFSNCYFPELVAKKNLLPVAEINESELERNILN